MKQKKSHKKDTHVLVAISPNDLAVIGHVLQPYAQFIRRFVPPSPQRDGQLARLKALAAHFANLAKPACDGEQLSLTVEEVALIDAALKHFVLSVEYFFPKTQGRDETVKACEALRRYLANAFAPSTAAAQPASAHTLPIEHLHEQYIALAKRKRKLQTSLERMTDPTRKQQVQEEITKLEAQLKDLRVE